METDYWKKITSTIILAILIVLSFFLLRPILLAIITGVIFAFIFMPIYKIVNKKIKNKNLSAIIVLIFLIIMILIPLWFLIPVLITQSINIFIFSQNLDLVTPLKNIFPSIFSSEIFVDQTGIAIQEFITKTTSSLMTSLAEIITNLPIILLKVLVALFIFFFTLRDSDKLIEYIQSILPFRKDIEKKLFKSTREITSTILYGQILLGIAQGIAAGLGFFIFGVDNALFLTIAAAIAGIFPIVGTAIVWMPVVVFLFIGGQTLPALGVIFFGLISSLLENVIRPIFVAKRTNVHSSVILLGMIGGIFLFGILGFILGPLILAYLLIVLEIYRDKKVPGVLINEGKN